MKTAIVALAAALAGAGLMAWKAGQDRASLQAELAGARTRTAEALKAAEAATATVAAARLPASPAPVLPPPDSRRASAARSPAADDSATRTELVRLLDEKNARLTAADSALGDARRRIADLEARMETVTREAEQLTASQKSLQEQLQTATRLTESLQGQIRSREERLAQTEVSNQDLRKRGEDSARRLGTLSDLVSQMDDLTRRRENYLNNVLRRYREVTELFRTLSLRLEGATTVTTELSRIQQAIGAADEDIRQINSLNAQSARLQRDLAAARR